MFNFLKDYETVNDSLVEKALDNYIELHNSTIKYKPNDIRDITDPVLINEIKLNLIKKTKTYNWRWWNTCYRRKALIME